MKVKALVLLAVFLLVGSVAGVQAQNTAQIYGRVTDASGAILPGVTVTPDQPGLLQPLTAVTSETGSYQFPGLGVGTYTVRYELTGFKTVIKEGIRIQLGGERSLQPGARDLRGRRRPSRCPVKRRSSTCGTRAGRTASRRRRCRASRRPATRGSSSSSRPAWRWTARTSAAARRASSRTSSRAARRWRSRSGTSTASTSPTCPPRAARRCTTTSTRSRRCRSRRAARTCPCSRRRRRQPGHQERHGQAQGLRPLLRHRRDVPVEQRHRRDAQERRQHRQPDPEHQGLRVRGRRPAQEGPRVALGQLRQAGHQRRHQQLLQGRRRTARP